MAPRKPRHLSPDEEALWNRVVEKAEPLQAPRLRGAEKPARIPDSKPKFAPMPQFRVGETAYRTHISHDRAPSLTENLTQAPVAMDRKSFGKMKKGRLAPEARIDLHGMTIAQAHPVLTRFILDNAALGRRLVLVITGKGKSKPDHGPIPLRHGVLRHQVPHWLHTAPLNAHVLQISEAHVRHGGHGALYVYLRRRRQ